MVWYVHWAGMALEHDMLLIPHPARERRMGVYGAVRWLETCKWRMDVYSAVRLLETGGDWVWCGWLDDRQPLRSPKFCFAM